VIEGGSQWATRPALAIATKRFADCLNICAMLQGQAANNRSITRGCVGGGIRFVIAEKNLRNAAVTKPTDGADIREAGAFEAESLGHAAVGQEDTSTHFAVLS
jgi:hypothetical protein